MNAKDLFLTFIYTGIDPDTAYSACFEQGVFSSYELSDLKTFYDTKSYLNSRFA